VTHLIDTSVWHRYARSPAVRRTVDGLVTSGHLLTTCPVIVAEYCFSARKINELEELQTDMGLLYLLESGNLTPHITLIQSALWSTGRTRAAGPSDALTAAYAMEHNQTIVTCDVGFVHIAQALEQAGEKHPLRVLHVTEPV
jgi:predicted nucleic acid-binding protein